MGYIIAISTRPENIFYIVLIRENIYRKKILTAQNKYHIFLPIVPPLFPFVIQP